MKPQVIESENVVCYDVDDTLVMWSHSYVSSMEEPEKIQIPCPHSSDIYSLSPHNSHIKLLKNHKERGKFIIVWSQGGYEWAAAVVKALGLNEYVDQIMSKPRAYIDDLPVEEWMKDRIYISPTSKWGQGEK